MIQWLLNEIQPPLGGGVLLSSFFRTEQVQYNEFWLFCFQKTTQKGSVQCKVNDPKFQWPLNESHCPPLGGGDSALLNCMGSLPLSLSHFLTSPLHVYILQIFHSFALVPAPFISPSLHFSITSLLLFFYPSLSTLLPLFLCSYIDCSHSEPLSLSPLLPPPFQFIDYKWKHWQIIKPWILQSGYNECESNVMCLISCPFFFSFKSSIYFCTFIQ